MRERLGIYAPNDDTLRLIPRLLRNPSLEIATPVIPEPGPDGARAPAIPAEIHAATASRVTGDPGALLRDGTLTAVIDGGIPQRLGVRHPELVERGVPIVSTFVARLLWGLDADEAGHAAAVLQALRDIVEAADFRVEPEDLCGSLLHLAVRVSGAEGGSFLVLDSDSGELMVGAAVGIERELWPKIRVPMDAGIAGRVAALRRPLRLRGCALENQFRIVRKRRDVAASLNLPLVHDGQLLGVLNLHHGSRSGAFDDTEFAFARHLAAVYARMYAGALTHATLRRRAGRDAAARRIREILDARTPLDERLWELCRFLSDRLGSGVASVYSKEPGSEELRLAATSLEGSRFGSEYRLRSGHGIDGAVAHSRQPTFLRGDDGRLAYAALPLLAGPQLLGVLTLQLGTNVPAEPDTESALRELAEAAASAIARAERERRATTRSDKLSAISEHHVRMIAAADLADVVRLGTSAAATILEADHAIVRLRDPRTGHFAIRSYFGADDGSHQSRLFHLDQRIASEAVRQRRPVLMRDLPSDPASSWYTTAAQSAIALPLWCEDRIVGTLAAYDRIASDRFTVGNFDDDDLALLGRFGAALEQAVAVATARERAESNHPLDADTDLPGAASVAATIHAEIVRSTASGDSLAVAVCSISNFDALDALAEGARIPRLAQRIASAMHSHVREFDVVGRTGPAEFTVVLPQPGRDPAGRVVALARAVADDIAKDDPLNDPVRVELGFGYAVCPDDGRDRESLLRHARTIRIEML
jgi:GAF domain-containing protein